MSARFNPTSQTTITVETISARPQWPAYLLPVSGFPVPESELAPIVSFLLDLCARAVERRSLSYEVFIQVAELHRGSGSKLVGANGRNWIPAMGMGIWPDRASPTLWTMEDFEEMDPNVGPRKLMHQLLRVSTGQSQRQAAIGAMAGLGTLLIILTDLQPNEYLGLTTSRLAANLEEQAFKGFPFYAPLVEAKSVMGASSEQIETWVGPSAVYLRESPEDSAILILSSEPLDSIFRELKTDVIS